MSIDLLYAPAKSDNPFEIAKRALIASLARVPVPKIDVTPDPEQFEDVKDFILAFAGHADVFMQAVGAEVKRHVYAVDLRWFADPFTCAIDGDATFELTRAREICAEDMNDYENTIGSVRREMMEG
jgi:hypothetical protein